MLTLENWFIRVVPVKVNDTIKKMPLVCGTLGEEYVQMVKVSNFDKESQTLHSGLLKFKLGSPSEEYAKKFPNAREAILKALEKAVSNKQDK